MVCLLDDVGWLSVFAYMGPTSFSDYEVESWVYGGYLGSDANGGLGSGARRGSNVPRSYADESKKFLTQ